MINYTLKVIEIRQETNDTVTVVFKQPGLKKIKYLSGQYLTLIFRINNRRYIRPYSLSSAPSTENTLNVTVKRIAGGIVSNHIVDQLKSGDTVEVMGPIGDFTLDTDTITAETSIFLWGAGSGITPLFSIAKDALFNNIGNHINLVYGNKGYDSTIFLDEINKYKEEYPDRFKVWHFHTQPVIIDSIYSNYISGRIAPETVLSALNKEHNFNNSVHFICGPAGLKESVRNTLHNAGINKSNIYYEDFEIIKDPKEFENIRTQNVQINFNGQSTDVEVVSGKSILEAGLDALLDLPYSCQTGTCLLCKGKLTKGQVKVIGVDVLPSELSDDDCLLCCSYPLTEDIEIVLK